LRNLRNGWSNGVQDTMHWKTLDAARLNSKRASSRPRGGEPSRKMGPYNIRRIDKPSVFRPRSADCIHTYGARVKGDDLPSCSMVDDVRVALRINNSTCYCCAARPATTITTILTRNAGPTDCGAPTTRLAPIHSSHINFTQNQQRTPKADTSTKYSEQHHRQHEPVESARRRHSVQETRSDKRRIGGHPR